jgi:hypothetical protein
MPKAKKNVVNKNHPMVRYLMLLPDEELFTLVHDVFALKFHEYARKPQERDGVVSFIRGLIQAGEVRKVEP